MPRAATGDRVGAIVSMTETSARIFGYGTYQGDEIPPKNIIGPFGYVAIENPKLVMDNGAVVWGCECWWGPEEKIKERLAGVEITVITPEEYRKKAS